MSAYSWLMKYRKNVVESPPENGGYVLVVFETQSVDIPGDERSRQAPGHGYPAHTETFKTPEIYLFEERYLWEEALEVLLTEKPKRKDVWAFQAGKPAKPRVKMVLDLEGEYKE